jgi:hypothetical protein
MVDLFLNYFAVLVCFLFWVLGVNDYYLKPGSLFVYFEEGDIKNL